MELFQIKGADPSSLWEFPSVQQKRKVETFLLRLLTVKLSDRVTLNKKVTACYYALKKAWLLGAIFNSVPVCAQVPTIDF
jgi:hypothetical protein